MLQISNAIAAVIAVQYNAGSAMAYHTLIMEKATESERYSPNCIFLKNSFDSNQNNENIPAIITAVKNCVARNVVNAVPVITRYGRNAKNTGTMPKYI